MLLNPRRPTPACFADIEPFAGCEIWRKTWLFNKKDACGSFASLTFGWLDIHENGDAFFMYFS